MKLLAISSYGGSGGSELSFAAFLRHRPPGIDPTVIVIGEGVLAQTLRERGERTLVATGYEGRPTVARLVRFSRWLTTVLREERPDVIWAMGQKAALLAAPSARLARIPIVWHKVDFSWDRWLAAPTAVAVNAVIGVSEAVAVALGSIRARRFRGVVWPQVTLAPELRAGPTPAVPLIGTLGRLVPYKGHHLLIRAAARLREEFPELRLAIAGDRSEVYPGYPETLARLTEELGIADAVEMPGFVDPSDFLPDLSVFVNATFRDAQGFGLEGLSGAMLEASWVGIPVVATRGGGTAEGMIDGVTGSLVSQAEPEQLAAAIAPYLRDPALAKRTSEAARSFARERFEPEAASRKLFSLLEAVAGGAEKIDAAPGR